MLPLPDLSCALCQTILMTGIRIQISLEYLTRLHFVLSGRASRRLAALERVDVPDTCPKCLPATAGHDSLGRLIYHRPIRTISIQVVPGTASTGITECPETHTSGTSLEGLQPQTAVTGWTHCLCRRRRDLVGPPSCSGPVDAELAEYVSGGSELCLPDVNLGQQLRDRANRY